ncbi:hypothetical protein M3Y99_01531600 [Aphelenchoides fujianensis]|nr:hypothetical protein M3Y99_01531600 [Aphelenchoides fujianensis]
MRAFWPPTSSGRPRGRFFSPAGLREELTAVLAKRADIDKYDIEDWLEDAFNEAFNLLLEDGSVPEMSQLLFECTDSIYKGDLPRAEAALARLPSSAQTQHLAQQTAVQEAAEESGSEPEDE